MIITLLITIGAPLAIVSFIIYSDKFKEPKSEIIKVFIFGILITIPAYILNTFLGDFWYNNTKVSQNLISSFLTAAPVEEGLKLSILYYFVYKMKDFNEPIDGIVYGVSVSLGFATFENKNFLFHYNPPKAKVFMTPNYQKILLLFDYIIDVN